MLILPIHKHDTFSHSLRSFISFLSDLKLSWYKSPTSLVNLTPRYLMFGDAILNRIDSCIAFSSDLLFLYKNVIDFVHRHCIWLLCCIGLLILGVFCRLFRVFYVYYHVLCKKSSSNRSFELLFSNLDTFDLFFIAWLLWQEHLILYWSAMERVEIFTMHQTSEGIL